MYFLVLMVYNLGYVAARGAAAAAMVAKVGGYLVL
jgi:hypothetical protein